MRTNLRQVLRAGVRYGHSNAKIQPQGFVQENGEDKIQIRIDPIPRDGEELETKRKRLIYQSRKRGILETDLLLSRFLDKYIQKLNYDQLVEYDQLLDETDWDIFYWATRNFRVTPLPDKWHNSQILQMLQELSENKEREVLRMPNLS